MAILPQNVVRHELIGLRAKVTKAKDATKRNIEGNVIDETQKTLVILTKGGERVLPKAECAFLFELPNRQRVEVDGRLLVGRPEERLKKKLSGKWEVI